MYSILIKLGTNSYKYDITEEGDVFSGDETETKARFQTLLQRYPISNLTVVHNTTVTAELTITDAQ